MKYILSQNKKDLYRCLGVHKTINQNAYGKKEITYSIEITHGYGEEQYYHVFTRYSSEENLNIVYDDIINFFKGNESVFELPRDEEVRLSDYELSMV